MALSRLEELNALAEDPDLWSNPENAQKIMRERTRIEQGIDGVREIEQAVQDQSDLIELAEEEGDSDLVKEAEDELESLRQRADRLRLESLLSGEVDSNNAYLQVNAGAGGTEAQDWANMLLRMYVRWAEAHDYKVEVMEQSDGEEAGIKSATISVSGMNAYGWLKTETGVHRLVRISPFDSNAKRHTSFA